MAPPAQNRIQSAQIFKNEAPNPAPGEAASTPPDAITRRTQFDPGPTLGAIRTTHKIKANPRERCKNEAPNLAPGQAASAPPDAVAKRTQSEPGPTLGAIRTTHKIKANPRKRCQNEAPNLAPVEAASPPPGAIAKRTRSEPGPTFGTIRTTHKNQSQSPQKMPKRSTEPAGLESVHIRSHATQISAGRLQSPETTALIRHLPNRKTIRPTENDLFRVTLGLRNSVVANAAPPEPSCLAARGRRFGSMIFEN